MEDGNCDKPFTCSTSDCNMRFSSKDHLSAHKKKHGMVLNLGTKTNLFGDQTPTPTRFIRNCEEVGLFQDLQNVNPFEETFRKAVEEGKIGSAAFQAQNLSSSSVSDDTLHTPHVFPHIIENDVDKTSVKNIPSYEDKEIIDSLNGRRPTLKVIRQEADTSQLKQTPPSTKYNKISVVVDSATSNRGDAVVEAGISSRVSTENTVASSGQTNAATPTSVQVILRMPDGRLIQLSAIPVDKDKQVETAGAMVEEVDRNGSGSVILRTTADDKNDNDNSMSLAKQKLRALLVQTGQTAVSKETLDAKSKGPVMNKAPVQQKTESGGNRSRINRRPSSSSSLRSEESDDEKRRKFLEKNRAAAMRCRQKRKSWIADLERRAEQMLTANQQLQLENAALKAEVAQLKTLLLAHKECPVTQAIAQAMTQGSIIQPAAPVFNVTAPVVETTPIVLTTPEENKSNQGSSGTTLLLLNPPHVARKRTTAEDDTFRQNLRKKLRNKSAGVPEKPEKIVKKRLSLNIETARNSSNTVETSNTDSPLVKSDEYLSSVIIQNDNEQLSFEVQDLSPFIAQKNREGSERPVATQVIQFNPNVLNRENNLKLPVVESREDIIEISPTDSYS